MQLRRAALVLTLAAGSHLFAAEAGIEFSGVLTADGKTRIALTDVASRSTTWVQAGDIFNGYTVARYDAKEDAVLLTKAGQELRLRLELPKSPDAGRPNGTIAATPAQAANPAAGANSAPATTAPTSTATAGASPSPAPASPTAPASPAGQAAPNSAAVTTTPPPAPANPSAAPAPTNPASPPAAATAASATAALPSVPESLPPTGRQTASPSYTIQGGDTLDSIALTQGVTVQQIRELNPALNSTSLRAGDTIRIR